MLPSPQETAAASSPKPPRRPRAIQACNLCRAKKYKCDGISPCSHCKRRGLNCTYRISSAVERAPSALHELEQKILRLQAENARLRALPNTASSQAPILVAETTSQDTEVTRSSVSRTIQGISFPGPGQQVTAVAESQDGTEEATPEDGTEIVEVNPHTRNVEYHGNTSSVAFIGRLREEYGCSDTENQDKDQARSQKQSLVSTFHNDVFRIQQKDVQGFEDGVDCQFFFPQSYVFLETYFNKLHYIHPILDKESFYGRCDDLWQGRFQNQSRSFIALYFSLVSLGALIRTWTEEKINGMGRFEWSRMLFEKAQHALGFPGSANDLEAAQAYVFMAKVCQNEINPNLAYTYLGIASRILLSIGANRKPADSQPQAIEASKTWWGFYTLEIELSFSLGRPDSLGMEDYHNRPPPSIDGSEIDIIPGMIGLSRIMRAISVKVYLHRLSLGQRLQSAMNIEIEMDAWVARLPDAIRPQFTSDVDRHCRLGDPPWAFYQRLVLQIRYYNVKMLLLRPFIVYATKHSEREPSLLDAENKCTDAAAKTIELLHETYRVHFFFHTWWYNITYLTFAVSIILFRAGRSRDGDDINPKAGSSPAQCQQHDYVSLIEQTLTMLDIMSESVVACKTAKIIRQMLGAIRQRNGSGSASAAPDATSSGAVSHFFASGTNRAGASRSGSKAASQIPDVPHAAVTGGDLEMTQMGLESLDASLWDWSFDFRDMWDNNGSGFQGFS
ncbi:Zn(II)2Cys6 transcription factor [Phyllosticta citriasiana]|uniref:Zn(II)2Cys6 transcription factor n=1 Tax=Phyllosticta citriasiana TaxID=595635 RepID=A0ABR1KVW6_9PEZI